MAAITFQIAETGFSTLTKTYTLPDPQMDRITAAYQQAANVAVNGTATRTQVLQYWVAQVIAGVVATVQSFENQAAVAAVPTATVITPT